MTTQAQTTFSANQVEQLDTVSVMATTFRQLGDEKAATEFEGIRRTMETDYVEGGVRAEASAIAALVTLTAAAHTIADTYGTPGLETLIANIEAKFPNADV